MSSSGHLRMVKVSQPLLEQGCSGCQPRSRTGTSVQKLGRLPLQVPCYFTPVTPEGLWHWEPLLTFSHFLETKPALQPWILKPAGGTRLLGNASATWLEWLAA
jgi:hypothetical protein